MSMDPSTLNKTNPDQPLKFKCPWFKFTEEKLGKAERTENDPHFETLARKSDKVKAYTEKLVKDGEAVLVPNPGKNQP